MRALLSAEEVARILGVTLSTVGNWRHKGRGPAYVRTSQDSRARVMYRPEDVEAWVAENTVKPKPMLSPDQAAHLLGVHAKTLEAWRRAGSGPPAYKIGGTVRARVRYRAEDIEAWVASQPYRRKTVQHDRDYYRCLDSARLIEEAKYNPNAELAVVLAERLEDSVEMEG